MSDYTIRNVRAQLAWGPGGGGGEGRGRDTHVLGRGGVPLSWPVEERKGEGKGTHVLVGVREERGTLSWRGTPLNLPPSPVNGQTGVKTLPFRILRNAVGN